MSCPPVIELSNISRTFDPDGRSGVRSVSLTIEDGEFVAIVGPSGAGKSTLLNLLGLLDRPDSGKYFFDGVDVETLREAERNRLRSSNIGFVFQSAFVLGDQTALGNAALGLRIQGVPMIRRSALAWVALSRLGIRDRWATAARLLSGGERQRLALARAIATRPTLILADEPTGNLDSENGDLVISHLRSLNAKGTTVVVITHDPAIAARADRQIEIIDGHTSELAGHAGPAAPHGTSRCASLSRPQSKFSFTWHRLRDRVADDLADAVSAMGQRIIRSLLLTLAFTLGISGLISSIGLSESASAQVSQRLTTAALDEVRITPPSGSRVLDSRDHTLAGWMARLRELPHVKEVGYVASVPAATAQIRRLNPNGKAPDSEYFLVAASPSYFRMINAKTSRGASFELQNDPAIVGSAWLGASAATGLGAAPPGPGSTIWAVGRQLDVVGTFQAGDRALEANRFILVTRDVLAGIAQVDVTIVVRTEMGFPAAVADAAPVALDPANPGQFRVETVADLRSLRFGVANDLGVLVGLLSLVLLGLAAISASTTMYLSVQSRSQEIALRRAIGASRFDVARLFLAEGLVVGLIGGVVGAIIGTFAVVLMAQSRAWAPVLPPELAPIGVVVGLLTGLVSSVVPAWAASKEEPATAIRR